MAGCAGGHRSGAHSWVMVGADGHLDTDVMVALGITNPLHQKRLRAAIATLDVQFSDHPSSLTQFRAANLRLVDMWLLPLSPSPMSLLAWVHFRGQDALGVDAWLTFEHTMYGQSFLSVALQAVVAPHALLLSVMWEYHDDSTYIDSMVRLVLVMRVLSDLLEWTDGVGAVAKKRSGKVVKTLLWALLCYYVLWWVTPTWILNLWFLFTM